MFFKKVSKDQLAITITPSHITLTTSKKSRVIPSGDILAPTLHILNLSKFITALCSFIETNNLKNPLAIIAFEDKGVHEVISDAHFTPSRAQQHLVWQGKPLSYIKNAPYYICGMSRELIFQYQLLAHHCGLTLLAITSCTYARLDMANTRYHKINLDQLKTELVHYDRDLATLKLMKRYEN